MRLLCGLWAVLFAACTSGDSPSESTLSCVTDPAVTASASGGVRIESVRLPGRPQGVVPLAIRSATPVAAATISIEVSSDAGGTWRAAHVMAAPAAPAGPAADGGLAGEVQLLWDSLADVGFRAPVQAQLRVRAGGGPACVVRVPAIENLHAAVRRVEHYMVSYGALTDASMAMAKRHDLVIVHPQHADLDRSRVQELQRGLDADDPSDDVIVLGYVSVGEDLRSAGISDDQARKDERFRGDGSGPRVDPRGPEAGGRPLDGIAPGGAPSNGGSGWAAYYLDDNSLQLGGNRRGDGIPDRNPLFGSFFVNAGAPGWFEVVDGMRRDGPDKLSGLREVLSTSYGRGLGCDGVFLDTIDTAAPNDFTKYSWSNNPTRFEWTAPGFSAFVARVHSTYPDRLVLQNRGLFFFDPRHPHYRFTTRDSVDLVLFESYRLNSNRWQAWDPFMYADNRYNLAPKLMAEANRNDGFKVLSLGYAEGPGLTPDTLVGKSSAGLESLLEDIRVTQELAGFRHYIDNAMVDLVNTFVLDHDSTTDTSPPVWASTFNDHPAAYPAPPGEPTARVGIQDAVPGPASGQITVRWDVAMDRNRVAYAAYYSTAPFDFAADPALKSAPRVPLDPRVPSEYTRGVGPGVFSHEAVLSGLRSGQTYSLVVRAFDDSPAHNEETNTVVLTSTAR